ncbi:MAG: NUDIX domain-containing protein [Alphaproteobacteria bacterium]|nr:NUDIX domain-containing protein [Alphaproteobacteria bacterium]
MADEMIDIYDSEMNMLGIALKSQAHKEGLWHKVFRCWIISEDGNIWLQLRGADKDLYPNLLDISCGGHLQVGETAKLGGLREMEEELGLHLKENDLVKLFTHKSIIDTPMINREFCPTYLHKTQNKLHDLKLQADEVDGIYEADIQDLIDLFFDDVETISIKGIKRSQDKYIQEVRTVGKGDFCPHGDKYYQKVFTTIQRFIDNQ